MQGRETLEHRNLKGGQSVEYICGKTIKEVGKFLKFYLSMKEVFLTEWS